MRTLDFTQRYIRLPAIGAALILALSSALIALANVPITRLSTDPYTNTSSMHQSEVEPDTFSYGSTTVGAFQVGRFYDGGSSNIGWATTTDNGANWVSGFLPGITIYQGGTHARDTDPAVAYDVAHGTWMIVSLTLEGAGTGCAV